MSLKRVLKILVALILSILFVEYGLRAAKSLWRDGTLYLASSSINSRPHPRYGWIGHSDHSFRKSDDCYGEGTISYNDEGFRAAPSSEAATAEAVICILGDSTMQGFQIPDGQHLPHLLSTELERRGVEAYVLPLAVGGYGSVQELLLFEDYCKPLDPDLVIWHWHRNDPANNSYLADRWSGPNSARPRPYLEQGQVVIRRAYPLRVHDRVDDSMILKVINGVLLKMQAASESQQQIYREHGWEVAGEVARRLAAQAEKRIVLLEASEERAAGLFRQHGFVVSEFELSDEHRCLPRDRHANPAGHRVMLDALLPHVLAML